MIQSSFIIELLCWGILLYGAWNGWKNGVIKEIIYFTGFFIGLYLAYNYYMKVGGGIIGFLLIWIGVPLLLGIAAKLLTALLDHIIILGTVNKLLGAAAGFLKYAFLLGCLIMVVDYVREVKAYYQDTSIMKGLQVVPQLLFPNVGKKSSEANLSVTTMSESPMTEVCLSGR